MRLPKARPGSAIGLLGGSFDPPHAGHVHISTEALKRLRLDRLWWLVTPGNPLKPDAPADLSRRMAAARALVRDRRITVTDVEAHLCTRYTADTLARLLRLYPQVRFVWIMGADNLAGFHRWESWDGIMRRVPVAVMPRPGRQVRAGLSPAAARFAAARRPAASAAGLARAKPPAWCLLEGPTMRLSSTELRAAGVWQR